jgi:prepilin-type N-terminal cleavage/methylation domain-containing protein
MKTRNLRQHHDAFTLIEMIGVLSIIAILASLLVPKIFESISNAHMSQTVLSCQTIKTAVLEHYAKYLSLASSNGVNLPASAFSGNPRTLTDFDRVLLAEGLIDKPFAPQIGSSSTLQLVDLSTVNLNKPLDGAYDLDGDRNADVTGSGYLVEAIIHDVSQADAKALNDLLDGASLGEAVYPQSNPEKDGYGRVIYSKPQGQETTVDVHIYVTHH